MVHFVGAGPGASDLITVRGDRLLREADVVIYAGSLVNPELLKGCRTSGRDDSPASYRRPEYLWSNSGADGCAGSDGNRL